MNNLSNLIEELQKKLDVAKQEQDFERVFLLIDQLEHLHLIQEKQVLAAGCVG